MAGSPFRRIPRTPPCGHAQCVAVAVAPQARPDALEIEPDSPWLVELRDLTKASSDLSVGVRKAVRQVVTSIIREGCTPRENAQARALLERL